MPLDPSIPLKANYAIPESPDDAELKQQQVMTMKEALSEAPMKRQAMQQELDTGKIDALLKKTSAVSQILGSVQDQAGWEQALNWANSNGLGDVAQQLPRQFDPKVRDSLMLRTLDAGKRLQLQMEQAKQSETERHNKATEGISATKAQNGGVIVDPDTGELTVGGGGGFGKAPTGYRFTTKGDLEPIAGGPAEKQTAQQAAQEALLDQSITNLPNIRKIMAGITPFSAADWARDAGTIGNAKRQLRQGIEAALRTMSGAAVPETEVERYSELFQPRFDDSPQTKQRKLDELEKFMSGASSGMKTGRITPARGTSPPVATGQRIKVQSPDGKSGSIDASELQDAIKNGWKQIQ